LRSLDAAFAVLLQAGLTAPAAEVPLESFELIVHAAPGFRTTKDQPMSAWWIEDAEGRFVRTLWRFGRATKYYPDLTVWHGLSAPLEKPTDLDAITGATMIHGDAARLRVPRRWRGLDLLSGRYVLRIESRQDQAKHFSSLRIPLSLAALGTTVEDAGYVRSIGVARARGGAADHVEQLPAEDAPPGRAP
jgi:hypothetical protein